MSLQNLARHMEAQGRGPDRTLVHMTPKEVQGLQAIAMAHGGSLTINPVTGLPEAGFLDKFLPAIAGFALNAFAPGVGTAVGSMFGLGSAAGTALTVGGISGLASGSLEKGIMAGLGAYGGAAVGEGLGNMGQTANMKEAYDAAAASGMDSSDSFMASLDKAQPDVSKGIAAAANAPKDFLKDNKYALAALAAPALMGSQGKEPAALPSSGYIRTMKRDPVTGEIYQESATPTGEWGGRPTGTYGGVARMADGGEVSNVLADVDPDAFKQVAYDTRTDSQKALDYLMGKPGAVNPMLFTSGSSRDPLLPLDYRTRTGGKYILNAATNTYDWVPDASSPTSGLPALNTGQGGGGSDYNNGKISDFLAKETFEEQSARNQKLNDFLTDLTKLSPTGMVMRGINTLFGAPKSVGAPISDLGTSLQAAYDLDAANNAQIGASEQAAVDAAQNANAMQSMQDAYNADMSAASQGQGGGVSDSNSPGADAASSANSGENAGGEGPSGSGESLARGGIAALAYGGLGSLGGYSDGGRLLRGPGNGTSDSIPATIGNKRPARLADGEFVIPSRIVSELGNGSTDAGARQLYAMMDRIQAARRKTVGKDKVAFDAKARKHLPA
jgi:hypothetical protein